MTWYISNKQTLMIPAEQLLRFIEDRGGLDDVITAGTVGRQEYQRIAIQFKRARARGYLDLFQADDFIVTHLGVHPCEVYGWAWFEFGEVRQEELEAAA